MVIGRKVTTSSTIWNCVYKYTNNRCWMLSLAVHHHDDASTVHRVRCRAYALLFDPPTDQPVANGWRGERHYTYRCCNAIWDLVRDLTNVVWQYGARARLWSKSGEWNNKSWPGIIWIWLRNRREAHWNRLKRCGGNKEYDQWTINQNDFERDLEWIKSWYRDRIKIYDCGGIWTED